MSTGGDPAVGGVSGSDEKGVVLVVGTGLIGTSIALALSADGYEVWLEDRDETAARLAAALGAGRPGRPAIDPIVVLTAVPPAATAPVIKDLQRLYLSSIFSDTASVKTYVERQLETLGADRGRFVGGHPLAGRERTGPGAARADLFEGRPWVLTPSVGTRPAALEMVRTVVAACRAIPVVVASDLHDDAVALVSHVPQIVASLTAARLVDAPQQALSLAGQGLLDMTRIADSDALLWSDIVASNAGPVLSVLDALADDLDAVRSELRTLAMRPGPDPNAAGSRVGYRGTDRDVDTATSSSAATRDLIERGNVGRSRLPGKHGAARVEFVVVPVVVLDRPGELARLLVASGAAGVNVEDVAIEHSPGQPAGLVELSVRPEVASRLADALMAGGWSVHV